MSKKSTFCERYARAVADDDVVEQATIDERQLLVVFYFILVRQAEISEEAPYTLRAPRATLKRAGC